MRLVYVFDPRCDCACYVVRVPVFLARLICRWSRRGLDYWHTPEGAMS